MVGIISNDKYKGRIVEDIQISKELKKIGIESEIISWEDPNVDYNKYSILVMKSVWGYHKNYDKFKNWMKMIKDKKINIFNSIDTIESNIKKDCQFELLNKYNISHIPSIIYKGNNIPNKIKTGKVVKPIISGSGDDTVLSENYDIDNYRDIINNKDNGIIVQPYIKEIVNGEYSIIYIDNQNTHNMIRYPGIFTTKRKPYQALKVPPRVLELAEKVKKIPEYSDLLYMRVDIVDGKKPMVMEVELAEPDLLTRIMIGKK